MFVKIVTLALTALFATAAGRVEWNALVASWDRNSSTHFYNLPRTLEAAENEGWTRISGVDQPKGVEALGYRDDPTLVLLYSNGVIAGAQVAFPVSEVNPKQPEKLDDINVIIPKQLNGEDWYYTSTVYFHTDVLTRQGRIWFQEKEQLHEIPTRKSRILSETPWLLKNCIPTMGIHYYQWNRATDCSTLYPWALLAKGEDIIGVLFQVIGSPSTIGARTWWEQLPDGALRAAMPDPPQCALDGVTEFGALSLHIWFVDKPQNIRCN